VRAGRGRSLAALEIDARRAFARWLDRHRRALGDILEHGTWLDRDDVDALLELPVPGLDELMGLREVARHAIAGTYDEVVVDTAPTGHTLRMLSSPAAVGSAAAALEVLQQDHRLVRQQFARVNRLDDADRLIELLQREAREIARLLRDRRSVSLHWLTLPEPLAVLETEDALRVLQAAGLAVSELIVNRVTPAGARCRICDPRRDAESIVLQQIRRRFPSRTVRLIDAQLRAPRGVAALAPLGDRLHLRATSAVEPVRKRKTPAPVPHSPQPLQLGTVRAARLLFCGGKGGVGKTTVAAVLALRLARASRRSRVLVLSTDPAHSLGDVFGVQAGDVPRPIGGAPPNLHVRELDAAAALEMRRRSIEAALRALAESFAGARTQATVQRGFTELIDLAPPGIDELFGVLAVVDVQRAYDVIVMDTAPTGHALRLLEAPQLARDWVQALMRMLLKYRAVVAPGPLASELVDLSRQIRSLQELLRDRGQTRFLVVTRAEELPRRETERLLRSMRRLRIAVPLVVVNAATIEPGACDRCRRTHAAERRQLTRLGTTCGRYGCAIIQAPLAAPPPRGVAALDRWSRTWIV
jgi:arsenite-transporting ATPase